MTSEQIEWALKLGRCNFTPGTAQKRFARSMAALATSKPSQVLTPKQAAYLELMVFRYRLQTGYTGDKAPDLGREVFEPQLGLIDLRNVGCP